MGDIYSFAPLWGCWNVEEKLGQGSYGAVYRVSRQEFGKVYYAAVKHISIPRDGEEPSEYPPEQIMTALQREIEISRRLRGQSHLVCYEDHLIVPKADGRGYDIFIRMELLRSLNKVMEERGFTREDVLRLGLDLTQALEELERQHIIHRDIKPSNIFVTDTGEFKLGDFGVARALEGTTGGVTLAGTYNYMAPEIFRGEAVNHTADIYSLGLVLYRLLNGNRAPFLPPPPAQVSYDDNNEALKRRLRGDALPPPAYANPELSQAILRACAFRTEQRWQTASEFRRALEGRESAPKTNRKPAILVGVVGALGVLISAAAILLATGVLPLPEGGGSAAPGETAAATQPSGFVISASASPGGSILPEGDAAVMSGGSRSFRFYPDEGYVIEAVYVDGVQVETAEEYTFLSVDRDHSLEVVFREELPLSQRFRVVKSNDTWWECYDAAQAAGGTLASVRSQEEYEYLIAQAEEQGILVLFLGAYVEEFSQWPETEWLSGGVIPANWWHSGEPNNDDGNEYYLALMKMARTQLWGLSDVPNDPYVYYRGRDILGYAIEFR